MFEKSIELELLLHVSNTVNAQTKLLFTKKNNVQCKFILSNYFTVILD